MICLWFENDFPRKYCTQWPSVQKKKKSHKQNETNNPIFNACGQVQACPSNIGLWNVWCNTLFILWFGKTTVLFWDKLVQMNQIFQALQTQKVLPISKVFLIFDFHWSTWHMGNFHFGQSNIWTLYLYFSMCRTDGYFHNTDWTHAMKNSRKYSNKYPPIILLPY